MKCGDLHVNMQDAAGDRTLAGELLRKDPTSWSQWTGRNTEKGTHELGKDEGNSIPAWEEYGDVHEQLGKATKKKFSKTPRVRGPTDSCRIYGSLDGNKVQGDFHITARGHGYMEFGEHLDHSSKSKHPEPSGCVPTNDAHSIQLLPHHPRDVFWTLLSLSHQPARCDHCCDSDA